MKKTEALIRCFSKAALLLACLMLFFFPTDVFAVASEEERVFDLAGLFTQEEKKGLEQEVSGMIREMKMDVSILTTDQAAGRTAKGVAEDFYIEKGLGQGKDYSGVLLLIDMDNRELYIAPVGEMNRYLTDERQDRILDQAYEYITSQDYEGCSRSFLSGVKQYYTMGVPEGQYNYDEETGKVSIYKKRGLKWYEILTALAIALGAAGFGCKAVAGQYSMKRQKKEADNSLMAYRTGCQFQYSAKTDRLLNTTVSHVIIPRNHGGGGGSGSGGAKSTTHSNSGRTFGGSGRKF